MLHISKIKFRGISGCPKPSPTLCSHDWPPGGGGGGIEAAKKFTWWINEIKKLDKRILKPKNTSKYTKKSDIRNYLCPSHIYIPPQANDYLDSRFSKKEKQNEKTNLWNTGLTSLYQNRCHTIKIDWSQLFHGGKDQLEPY